MSDYEKDSVFAKLLGFLSPSEKSLYQTELNDAIALLKEELFPMAEDREAFAARFSVGGKEPKAMVFGAGTSCGEPIGLPTWKELLKNAIVGHFLADNIFDASLIDKNKIKEKEIKDKTEFDICKSKYGGCFEKYDLYELAQYVENMLDEFSTDNRKYGKEERKERAAAELYTIVEKSLYYSARKKGDDNTSVEQAMTGDPQFKNHLLYAIGEYVDKAAVNRVLTYNYDNSFEFVYENIEGKQPNKKLIPIFIDNQLSYADECDSTVVYHVHGYVPYFQEQYNKEPRIKKALCSKEALNLILSERSYDDMSYSSYKWRNVVQIDTFLRYNCLFFGFSAEDKNFKRIVKLMGRSSEGAPTAEDVKHYIFMTADDYVNSMFGVATDGKNIGQSVLEYLTSENCSDAAKKNVDKINDFDKLLAVKFLYYILRARRKYLKNLNISPVWTVKTEVRDCFEYMLNK